MRLVGVALLLAIVLAGCAASSASQAPPYSTAADACQADPLAPGSEEAAKHFGPMPVDHLEMRCPG
jgi:hypothetical protein